MLSRIKEDVEIQHKTGMWTQFFFQGHNSLSLLLPSEADVTER